MGSLIGDDVGALKSKIAELETKLADLIHENTELKKLIQRSPHQKPIGNAWNRVKFIPVVPPGSVGRYR